MVNELKKVKDYSTVKELIDLKVASSDLNFYSTSILYKIGDIEFPIHNVIYDYLDVLLAYSQQCVMTDKELDKYRYRPDMLSHYLYNTIDYEFLILIMNQMITPKEFNRRKIRVIEYKQLNELLNKIYNSENSYITKNRQTYNEPPKSVLLP